MTAPTRSVPPALAVTAYSGLLTAAWASGWWRSWWPALAGAALFAVIVLVIAARSSAPHNEVGGPS